MSIIEHVPTTLRNTDQSHATPALIITWCQAVGLNPCLQEPGEPQLQCLQQLRLRYQVSLEVPVQVILFCLVLCGVAMVREVGCMGAKPARLL